ncbi:hypothetical protein [Brevibacterium oceani]|uniref:hypothetical protein n=1 Tax=Brevibacterium oceani TaxID=358099 RepID=UPI0015E6920E|nr:hypothetical protein [Brevibacterium oceani]
MDIPSLLATYGGPGGFIAVLMWLFIADRKFNAERRTELREDIDREKADNDELRARVAQLESELRIYRDDGGAS